MKIVLLSAKQGGGKTTLQKLLAERSENKAATYCVNFADILYEMHDAVLAILNRYWPKRDIAKDGPLLQVLGTEWGRRTLGEDVWVKCLQNKIKMLPPESLVIIGDCRFENEFDGFPQALRIRLVAPEQVRKARCSMWRENTRHPSEVSLDKYEAERRFDLMFDTHVMPAEVCADQIYSRLTESEWAEKRQDPRVTKATPQYEEIANYFTEELRALEKTTGCGVNFQWAYGEDGKKRLKVADVAPLVMPCPAVIAAAKSETPRVLEQAYEDPMFKQYREDLDKKIEESVIIKKDNNEVENLIKYGVSFTKVTPTDKTVLNPMDVLIKDKK